MASNIQLYKNGSLVRTIGVNDSGVISDLRDYIGPSMPELVSEIPNFNEIVTDNLTGDMASIYGDYINKGLPLTPSNKSASQETSILRSGVYLVILFSIYADEADKVKFNYQEYKSEVDLTPYSTKSKKTLGFVITTTNTCELMDLFHMVDNHILELKSFIRPAGLRVEPTEVSNKWDKHLYGAGGSYFADKVAEVIDRGPLDNEQALKNNFKLHNIYETE